MTTSERIVFLDAHYARAGGAAAALVADSWVAERSIDEQSVWVDEVAPYRPGAFFERELRCLMQVLGRVDRPTLVVIDGYVVLDGQGRPGLGAHLHERLGGSVPVVGVAKTAFQGSLFAQRIVRGSSLWPLFVTAKGIDPGEAAELVRTMRGEYRVPTLLARVDGLARALADRHAA
jgi:deoxyribonuclease V